MVFTEDIARQQRSRTTPESRYWERVPREGGKGPPHIQEMNWMVELKTDIFQNNESKLL